MAAGRRGGARGSGRKGRKGRCECWGRRSGGAGPGSERRAAGARPPLRHGDSRHTHAQHTHTYTRLRYAVRVPFSILALRRFTSLCARFFA